MSERNGRHETKGHFVNQFYYASTRSRRIWETRYSRSSVADALRGYTTPQPLQWAPGSYPAKDKVCAIGWTGTTPVMGHWNGDGKRKPGAFINGYWHLDYNGNGSFDGSGTDKVFAFGAAGDNPVVRRW